jgi:hypothetical protein
MNPNDSLPPNVRHRRVARLAWAVMVLSLGTIACSCAGAHRRQVYYPGFEHERPSDNWRTPGTVPVPPPRFEAEN